MSGEEDAYTETSVQDVFNEDGIVLDPVSVLPVQYKITSSLLPLAGTYTAPVLIQYANIICTICINKI